MPFDDQGTIKARVTITTSAPADLGTGDGAFSGVQLWVARGAVIEPREKYTYTGEAGAAWVFDVVLPYPLEGDTEALYFPSFSPKYSTR